MSKEQNLQATQRLGEAVSTGNLQALNEIFASSVVDHVVQDENNLAMAYKIHGTHKGDFLGIAPTGKSVEARGMQIGRYENGKIVERWGSSDELGLVKQLGASIDTGKGFFEKVGDKLGG